MSTFAIDDARDSERLSAFLSEIANDKPIDNYFPRVPVIEKFMANKKMLNGGRQAIGPIDSGENATVKDFSDYDLFDVSAQNTALTVGYPMVNKGGTITISWEEMRETAGDNHKIFDLVQHKRDNTMKTITNQLATDLFAAAQDALKITCLPIAVLGTGALGGLNQTTDADWAADVNVSGSFAAQGLSDMRTLYNAISAAGADPDMIVTTLDVYNYYEKEIDPDVRYASLQGKKAVGSRGFGGGLEFNGIPIMKDLKCNAGVMYMLNSENLFFYVDTEGNFRTTDFKVPTNQEVFVSKVVFRGQLYCNRRKSLGKLTTITA